MDKKGKNVQCKGIDVFQCLAGVGNLIKILIESLRTRTFCLAVLLGFVLVFFPWNIYSVYMQSLSLVCVFVIRFRSGVRIFVSCSLMMMIIAFLAMLCKRVLSHRDRICSNSPVIGQESVPHFLSCKIFGRIVILTRIVLDSRSVF